MSDDRNNFLMVTGRASYPHLFEKDKYDRYSMKLLLEEGGESHTRLVETRKDVLAKAKMTEGRLKQDCYDPDPDISDTPENDGFAVLVVKKKGQPPHVLSHNKRDPVTGKPVRIVDSEDSPIYPGCWVNARINVYAFKHAKYGNIFSVDMVAVQWARDDEPFSGGHYSDDDANDGFDANEDAGDGMFD